MRDTLKDESYDLYVVDAGTAADISHVVRTVHTRLPAVPIVVLASSPDWRAARLAFEAGATDYLSTAVPITELADAMSRAVMKNRY